MGKQEQDPVIGYRGMNNPNGKGKGGGSEGKGEFSEHGNRSGKVGSEKGSYKVGSKKAE